MTPLTNNNINKYPAYSGSFLNQSSVDLFNDKTLAILKNNSIFYSELAQNGFSNGSVSNGSLSGVSEIDIDFKTSSSSKQSGISAALESVTSNSSRSFASITSNFKSSSLARSSQPSTQSSSSTNQSSQSARIDVSSAPASEWSKSLLTTAAGELGTSSRSEVAKYRNGQDNGAAWCASFVSWCLKQTYGDKNPMGYEASCSSIQAKATKAGVYAFKENYTPKPGDLVRFLNNGQGHIGIVQKVENGKVYTVEGNTWGNGDNTPRVMERSYSIDDGRINGYVKMDEWIAKS